jgi:pimeloyl-ACP methyl ester carboxylesterase
MVDNPVILFLHGFGFDGSIWLEQAVKFSDNYKIIIPDLPGSGQSPYYGALQTIEDFSDVIYALCEYEKADNIAMFGHSMGGYIALAFAEKYAGKLTALGLIHSTAFADSPEKKEIRKRGIALMEEYGGYAFLKTTVPNLFSEKSKKEKSAVVEHLIEKGHQFSKEALVQYYFAMMQRKDRSDVLAKIQVPVLFIVGYEDMAAPKADILLQVSKPRLSEIYLWMEIGHMSMFEHPNKLTSALSAFISNIAVLTTQ